MRKRTIEKYLDKYLKSYGKMVFLSGPRQVGKTTLTMSYMEENGGGTYFNWDIMTDQKKFVKNPYFFEEENQTPGNIVILDEIHKYSRWKNYLKGVFDKFGKNFSFIVTGSGRLDLFKKGGDSLLGRYLTLPLFPFSVSELSEGFTVFGDFLNFLNEGLPNKKMSDDVYDSLFELSGFPDPLLRGDKSFYNIWKGERAKLLFREDIRDATKIREISQLEILSHLIADKIGSPLSINSLREDVGVAFETVRDWIKVLSQFYYLFQIRPYAGSLSRTLRKETKVYLFDWAEIDDVPIRFENFVAVHLLKATKTWKSTGEGDIGLRYIRDKEKREVDFVITEKNKPVCLIEVKVNDENLSTNLLFYQDKLNVPVAVQLLHKKGVCKRLSRGNRLQWIVSADRFFEILV